MTLRTRLPFALIVAMVFAGAAAAAEPEAMATAQGAGAPPSVADQIDTYLKTSPAAALPRDAASGATSGSEPRQVHGMVDVAVGTGGYRSAYVASEIPVGKTGTATIAVGETRFGNRFGRFAPSSSQSLGLGMGFDGATLDPTDCRRRQAGEAGPDMRLDPRIEGERLRPCQAAEAPTSPQ
jgi:hypothetical protein